MNIKKTTLLLAASLILSSVLIMLANKRVNIFHCTSLVDRLSTSGELHSNSQIFIYNDHTGFLTHKGTLTSKGNKYVVDREVNFEIRASNKDKVMTLISKGVIKKPRDTVPDEDVWNRIYEEGLRYYPVFLETATGDTLIVEGGKLNSICSQKNE